MEYTTKILIADDNLDFVSTLITYFDTQDDVEIIATANDGCDISKLTNEMLTPDIEFSNKEDILLDGEKLDKKYVTIKNDKRIHAVVVNVRDR